MLTINVIGCGKLGKTLAFLIRKHRPCNSRILAITNASYESSQVAAQFVGEGVPVWPLSRLPKADIYFIITPDKIIESICQSLVNLNLLEKHNGVIHCSGLFSSTLLSAAKEKGCLIASVHPAKSFPDPTKAIQQFEGTYCTFEGDELIRDVMKNIFEGIGGKLFDIQKENKAIYHIGSILANNYLITLHFSAFTCYLEAGLPPDSAFELSLTFMKESIGYLEQFRSHPKALTGPIARGDLKTVEQHLETLLKSKPMHLHALYQQLGKITTELATSLSAEQKKDFFSLLEEK